MSAHSKANPHALVMAEHLALIRQMARLQWHMDHVLAASQARDVRNNAEILRLRGQLLAARTAALWGLSGLPQQLPRVSATRTRVNAAQPLVDDAATRDVICQTGCAGHAHTWLAEDGRCQRDGRECERAVERIRHM